MANNFRPGLTINPKDIEIGRQFLFKNVLQVDDLDPDSQVIRYRFRDNNAANTSGFFIFKGERMQSGVFFTVQANEIDQLIYRSGMIEGTESVSGSVFDGKFESTVASGLMSTVVLNARRPNVTLESFNVLSGESVSFSDYVSASDPDGNPIQFYRIVDRLKNANGGYFSLNGVRQPSGQFFDIPAAQFDSLEYVGGRFGQTENIGIFASDGRFLSLLQSGSATTTPNSNRPEVVARNIRLPADREVGVRVLFNYSDADGNTLKGLRVLDTGGAAGSGHFSLNGTELDANQWHTVSAEQINSLNYNSAQDGSIDNFRIMTFDGKFYSVADTGTVMTFVKPEVEVETVIRLNDFEVVNFIDRYQDSSTVSTFRHEILDLNDDPLGAKFVLDGVELEAGVIHTLNSLQLERLKIKGGTSSDEGRKFDRMMVRSFNGAWSDWNNTDVDTTEVAEESVLDLGVWPLAKRNLTFSFPNELPAQHAFEGFVPMTAGQRAAIRDIYDHLSTLTNLTFTEVSGTTGGDLELFRATLPDGVLGIGFPPSNLPNEVAGDFVITPDAEPNPEPGGLTYFVVIHELGHTMGLKHVDNNTGAGDPPLLPPALQDARFSVMGSFANPPNGSDVFPGTFQLFDALALQKLYGANTSYNAGNTQIRGIAPNDPVFQTIWDGGGFDTINRTQDTIGGTIDLREGRFSSLGGQTENVSIVYGAKIEAARGGRGDDTLIGNEMNNLLIGNIGDDVLRGHGGRDVMRGLENDDTYQWAVGDAFNIITEVQRGGIDTIELIGYAGLDDFTEDMTFRKLGRNLMIDFSIDRDFSQGGLMIKDQAWGGSRIETLRFVDTEGEEIAPDVDLVAIMTQATSIAQRFQITNVDGEFGKIAVPV